MMDKETQIKNHSSEHDGHGVHVCHKCGWPFPNPHPSAKHRRAHKKVCGTIEGYKLVGSEQASNLTGHVDDDDDDLSDDDHNSPSPKVVESSHHETDAGGAGERSNRSEFDVFTDAPTEFTDSGSSSGIEEHVEDVRPAATDADTIVEDVAKISEPKEDTATNDHDAAEKNAEHDAAVESSSNEGKEKRSGEERVGVAVSSSKSSEASQVLSNIGVPEGIVPDSFPASGVVPLSEEIDEVKVDASKGKDVASSYSVAEHSSGMAQMKDDVHVLSVPSDTPVEDNVEIMIKGFKDHVVGKLPLSVDAHSLELVKNVNDSVPEKTPLSSTNEVVEVSALSEAKETDVPELHVSSNETVVGEAKETDVPELHVSSNETVVGEVEKSHVIQQLSDSCKEHPMKDTEVPLVEAEFAELVSADDTGKPQKVRREGCDLTGNNDNKSTAEENSKDTTIQNLELEVNESTTLHVGDTENKEDSAASGSMGANLSAEEPTAPGSATDLHESDGISERNLPEPENPHLNRVLDDQEGTRVIDDSDNTDAGSITGLETVRYHEASKKASEDPVMKAPLVSPSDAVTSFSDVEVIFKEAEGKGIGSGTITGSETAQYDEASNKTSGEHVAEEIVTSPSDASLSLKTSTAEENCAKNVVGDASENDRSASLPDASGKQPGTFVADSDADSSSQTGSLEGHTGCVSVFSTESDIAAVVDAKTLPSNGSDSLVEEAEKFSLKNPKAGSEVQNSDKSDLFEPPSFMTLIEPRDGSNPKAGGSQDLEQPKDTSLKAGWFPTLTIVTNDSQGRKKNEDIIAKVVGKQQPGPLKIPSPSGDATIETKSKLSNTKEIPNATVQKDDTLKNDNVGPKEPAKEWNSLKRDKKPKGRPIWAQFVCCSSPN